MEFAKYYDVTKKSNEMIDKGELSCYTKDYCKGLFVCADTHVIWVCRILEDINKEYEKEEGTWLIERNKIDKYELCEFIKETMDDDSEIDSRYARDCYIDECFELGKIIELIILKDDNDGLENWDISEGCSYDECINAIDGGFGIIQFKE